jgi:hypothetical protein
MIAEKVRLIQKADSRRLFAKEDGVAGHPRSSRGQAPAYDASV